MAKIKYETDSCVSRRFQELTIKDAFMFAAVMSDPGKCKKLLEIVLEQRIVEVEVITEKTMIYHPEYHGVRLDVLAEEHGSRRRFNIEMQIRSEVGLPKRSRYYHSQLDMDALESGRNYSELPDTYVIFICDFVVEKDRLYKYTYRNICLENNTELSDGAETILLSTKGINSDSISKELVSFLKYVETPESFDKEGAEKCYAAEIDEKVSEIKKSREYEVQFMLLEEMIRDAKDEGYNRGLEKGQEQLSALIRQLIDQGRTDDVTRVADDKDYRDELLRTMEE